jgi:hypothetical protein
MDTVNYTEVQKFRAWWIWALVAGINVLFIYAIVQQIILGRPFGTKPAPDIVLILVELVLLLILIFFISIRLKTRISDAGIHYRFSPFHLKERTIEWHELRDAYMRDYNSLLEYGGWGIRIGSSKTGRAINTSESSKTGLQLQFHDGRLLLIGTKNPDAVAAIIEKMITAGKINRGI